MNLERWINEGWIKEVKTEDIPSEYRDLVDGIGLDAFLRLAYITGGNTIYFPKLDRLIQPARDRMIIKEYNGSNLKELVIKYELTDVWVRKIISEHFLAKNQIKLFDDIAAG
jgi:Mor family transcriptional regulator